VEQLGAGSVAEGVEALTQDSVELVDVHGVDANTRFPVDFVRGEKPPEVLE
jgi:hypothetical protein